ncbi:hypothetical protein V1478_002686 [Vespula squamosa]|uniref:Uncharacterized protein n=1 Tax=Vespula squamosa TaxID=30214 RepID=A0ABD2BT97_VESSQ
MSASLSRRQHRDIILQRENCEIEISKFLTERYEDEGELRIVWLSVNIYREYSVSLSCQRIEEEDERDFCRATGQGRGVSRTEWGRREHTATVPGLY